MWRDGENGKKKKEKEKLLMEAYGEPWVYKKFTTELPNAEANEIKSSFDNPLINFPLKNQ